MKSAIESAMASLAASLPDASVRMRHGDAEGVALSASSRELSGDTLSADAPQEMRRVIARRLDFPSLAKGCAVEVENEWHIVTSARTDPVCASLTVGLSASLSAVRVAYSRPGTKIRQPLDALAVESDTLEPIADSFAPTSCRAWFVAFTAEDWREPSEPQVGDALTLDGVNLRVASVAKHDSFWILTCRSRR